MTNQLGALYTGIAHPRDGIDSLDDDSGLYCDTPGCESPAVNSVPVSVNAYCDERRNMCYPCTEAYTAGAQHASYRAAVCGIEPYTQP